MVSIDMARLRHISEAIPTAADHGLRIFDGLTIPNKAEEDWGIVITERWQPLAAWIKRVHNIHKGQRCFMMGTGPSLAGQLALLPKLATEETWTVNRIVRWDQRLPGGLPFQPTHHVIAEPGPVLGFGQGIGSIYDFTKAKNRIAIHWSPVFAPGWLWCPKAPDEIQMRWEGFQGFDEHLPPLPSGWASPLTACQLAAWMGYSEFYFLGIDTTQQGQAWDPIQGRTAKPRNIRSIMECFERARQDIERAGRKVYDCTPGGRINAEGILPYISLEEVLA